MIQGTQFSLSYSKGESCSERALLGAAWRIKVVTDIADLRSALEPVRKWISAGHPEGGDEVADFGAATIKLFDQAS